MSVRTDLIEDLIEEGKIDYVSLSDVLSEAEQQGAQAAPYSALAATVSVPVATGAVRHFPGQSSRTR